MLNASSAFFTMFSEIEMFVFKSLNRFSLRFNKIINEKIVVQFH